MTVRTNVNAGQNININVPINIPVNVAIAVGIGVITGGTANITSTGASGSQNLNNGAQAAAVGIGNLSV
jgi:hypothetical protein